MYNNSKSTIWKILFLYLFTSGIFLSLILYADYNKQIQLLIVQEATQLKEARAMVFLTLRKQGISGVEELLQELGMKIVILDKNEEIIFSNFEKNPKINTKKFGVYLVKSRIYMYSGFRNDIYPMGKNLMQNKGLRHLNFFIQGHDISKELQNLKTKFIIFGLLTLLAISIIAYFLVKLSLKPLYENIKILNNFIKDSTHEINAPLSVILMSTETMDKNDLSQKNLKRVNNIQLAAQTLSSLYEDLVSLKLSNNLKAENISFDLILKERLNFFQPLISKENLEINTEINASKIKINKKEIQRIIDNLLSNAIKYSPKNSKIQIYLKQNYFIIQNHTRDRLPKDCKKLFQEYSRFNNDEGGFGLGLPLVLAICKRNKIKINCILKNNKISFELFWRAQDIFTKKSFYNNYKN